MPTKDEPLRSQIEAIKSFLVAEDLEDVEDHAVLQKIHFEGFHTIRCTFNGKAHFLRLAFGWLEEQMPPERGVDWLRERLVADMLKEPDRIDVRITDSGQIGGQMEYPV